jgi:hypothetical protein
LQATVHAWHPMQRSWSMTKPYFTGGYCTASVRPGVCGGATDFALGGNQTPLVQVGEVGANGRRGYSGAP